MAKRVDGKSTARRALPRGGGVPGRWRGVRPAFGEVVWSLGYVAARRKAFVADGGRTNWSIWQRHFRHLDVVPILDFIRALTYVYSAALAGRVPEEGGTVYLRWITWVW